MSLQSLKSLFEWVDTFPSGIAIRESLVGYPVLLTSHVVSMCVFSGLIVMMDLRLLGMGNMGTPFTQVQKRLFAWQMFGMATSFLTGLVLLYAQPMRFYGNFFFWVKEVMIILAGINAYVFHKMTYRSVASWDSGAITPSAAKWAGGLSLALWAGVVVSGRLIAYNWFAPPGAP